MVSSKPIHVPSIGSAFLDPVDGTVTKYDNSGINRDLANPPVNFVIKSNFLNPADGCTVITAELIKQYLPYGRPLRFNNADILVIKLTRDGDITWIKSVRKFQLEDRLAGILTTSMGYDALLAPEDYYEPDFSSYKSLVAHNKLFLIFNDHQLNTTNAAPDEKVRMVKNFGKGNLYGVSIDITSGVITRQKILENDGKAQLRISESFTSGNQVFIRQNHYKDFNGHKTEVIKIKVE